MSSTLEALKKTCKTGEARAFIASCFLCFGDTVLTGKLAWGSDSLTLLSAFYGAVIDLLAVTAGFVAFVIVRIRRQSKTRFAFGIGKLENIISMVIAVLMLLGAQKIIFEAVNSIRNPRLVDATLMTVALFMVYALVSILMYFHYRKLVKKHKTPIIKSQYALWYSRLCYDIPVAIAVTLIYFYQDFAWGRYLDPIASQYFPIEK